MARKAATKKPVSSRKSKDRLLLERLMDAINESEHYEDLCSRGRSLVQEVAKHVGVEVVGAVDKEWLIDLDDFYFALPDHIDLSSSDLCATVTIMHIPTGKVLALENHGIYQIDSQRIYHDSSNN